VRRAVAVVLAFALGGCATRAVVRGDLGERRWHAVSSPFVTLYTDLDAEAAADLGRELEVRRRVMSELYGMLLVPDRAVPASRLVVVHLDVCADLHGLWGPRTAGQSSISADFLRQRIALTCEDISGWTREIVTHELAHLLSYQAFRALPAWLEEGLATYFQTLAIYPDRIVLGGYPSREHRALQSGWLVRGRVEWRPPPPVRELRAMPDAAFRRLRDGYLVAWRVVHFLATASDADNRRFRRFLRAVGDGAAAEAAWADAFADRPDAALDRDLRGYLRDGRFSTWTVSRRAGPPPEVRVRTLRPGEVHDVWMQTILTFGEAGHNLAYAEQQLALSVAATPEWTGADYWRAVIAVHRRRPVAEIEAALRRHVARAPGELRGATALLVAALDGFDDDGLGPEPPPGLDDLADEVAALRGRAGGAVALDTLAWYFALQRRPEEGEGLARRALAVEPGCAVCENTLALLLYQRGRPAEAIAHQERALRLIGDDPEPRGWRLRLEAYRAAAAATADR
jgi:tetratricopeptide (TPR) repeat protein